ncbi:MAG: cupin domain-containing protein [Bacillota bacterium]
MQFVNNPRLVGPDQTKTLENGFNEMELRWLLTEKNAPVTMCCVGHTLKNKGGEHRLHHHENAEEIIVMLRGRAVERIGDQEYELSPGDCAFIPKGAIHSHKVVSTDQVETVFIYVGATSFEGTGYVLDQA